MLARLLLAGQRFEHATTELAFIDALAAVDGLTARRRALDERLSRIAQDERLWPDGSAVARVSRHRHAHRPAAAARARRRLATLRFAAPTGSAIARRLLVEAAWHYTRPPRVGATLANRQTGEPDHILQIAWRAQHRLHRAHHRLRERGKPANVTTIAVARQLTGFLWAAATAT